MMKVVLLYIVDLWKERLAEMKNLELAVKKLNELKEIEDKLTIEIEGIHLREGLL